MKLNKFTYLLVYSILSVLCLSNYLYADCNSCTAEIGGLKKAQEDLAARQTLLWKNQAAVNKIDAKEVSKLTKYKSNMILITLRIEIDKTNVQVATNILKSKGCSQCIQK
ncbi:MAG: hypothetical protein ABIQ95_14505 [Bdellovibrionia bacterium]